MRFIAMTAASATILASALTPLSSPRGETLLPPSPEWAQAMPSGPVAGTRMTAEYVKQVGRMAYLWAWPMMNIEGRLLTFRPLKEHGLSGGVLPVGPVNEVTMLTDAPAIPRHSRHGSREPLFHAARASAPAKSRRGRLRRPAQSA